MDYKTHLKKVLIEKCKAICAVHYGALGSLIVQKYQWDAGWLHYNLIVVFEEINSEVLELLGKNIREAEKELDAHINIRPFSRKEIEKAANENFLFQGTDSPAIFLGFEDAELIGGEDLRPLIKKCGSIHPGLVAFRVMMLKFKFEKLLGSSASLNYRLVEVLKRLMSSVQGVITIEGEFVTDSKNMREKYSQIMGEKHGKMFDKLMGILENYSDKYESEYNQIVSESYELMIANAERAKSRYLEMENK